MTMTEATDNQIELGLIDGLLADLGTLSRRNEAETLTEEEGHALLNRMRSNLRSLRAGLAGGDEAEIVLTDAGGAALMAFEAARQAQFREAVRRSHRMTTGRALMEKGVDRARFHGDFAVLDGGRT